MKRVIRKVSMLALIAASTFTFLACSSSGGGGDDDNNSSADGAVSSSSGDGSSSDGNGGSSSSVGDGGGSSSSAGGSANLLAGKFASQNGGSGDAKFFANYKSAAASKSKVLAKVAEMSATEKELVGKIEDGDIIFNLSGIHDTESNTFFLTAGSSFLIYEIGGTLSSAGSISDAEATVKIKSGSDWAVVTIPISESNDNVAIAGDASTEQKAGIPLAWCGKWLSVESPGSVGPIGGELEPVYIQRTITEFSIDSYSIVDVKTLSAGKLELIKVEPEVVYPDEGKGSYTQPALYTKMWLEETADGLKITDFSAASVSSDLAEVVAFDATNSSGSSLNYVRP